MKLSLKILYKKLGIHKIKNDKAKKIINNSSWLVSDKIFTLLLGVFVSAITARYFGPEQFGQFNYALAFVSLFTAFSTLGLEVLTVKSLVEKEFDEGTILCTSLFLRIFGGVFLTIFTTLVIRIIEPKDYNLQIIVLIMSFSMTIKSLDVIEYWIQAHQKAKVSSIIRMVVTIITSILKILLVVLKGNLILFACIYTVDAIIISFALLIAYFKIRKSKSNWRFNLFYAKNIMSQSWYLIISGIMITLYMRLDQVMLGYMFPNKEVLGIYSAAVRIAEMWYFVPMAVITSFRPIIMSTRKINEKSYLKSLQLLYSIVTWIGICFGLIILLLSKPAITLLYGQEYIGAYRILSVSVWTGIFATIGSARSIWLLCEGLQRYSLIQTFSGLIINFTLNLFLIPRYGAYGAAIATLMAQFFANIIIFGFFKRTRISFEMVLKSFNPMIILNRKKEL